MDTTEDVSARILLQQILSTEPPRTPVTQSATSPRRSSRLVGKDAGPQSPQSILRRSMKNKLRESITRKSLPFTRRTASIAPRKSTPAPASMLLDDKDTPRHILRNILATEPVRSPVFHQKIEAEEPQPPSADSSIASKRPSIELSTLDLPDVTIGIAASTVKGLSRKRPHRTFDVTAIEKLIEDRNEANLDVDHSVQEHSSLSISSSTSLSLKTPFVDPQTERRVLQRRVRKHRNLTEEEFGHIAKERQTEMGSLLLPGGNDTTFPEDFTLGLSKFVEPDITTDLVNCNTALYTQHDALASSLLVPTQDKATVIASQLQQQVAEAEPENLMPMGREKPLPTEEAGLMSEDDLDASEVDAAEEMGRTSVRHDEGKTDEVETQEEAEMVEPVVRSQTEEDEAESQPEEEARATSLSEEEPGLDSQNEGAEYQEENNEEFEDEQETPESPSPDCQAEDKNDNTLGEKDEEESSQSAREHISRRAHCSEGGVVPVGEAGGDSTDVSEKVAGWPDGKHNTFDTPNIRDFDSGQLCSRGPDEDESLASKQPHLSTAEANENTSPPSYEDIGYQNNAAAEESDEEIEEDDDSEEDDGELPAFVREKVFFSQPDPVPSPSVLKMVEPSAQNALEPAPKPKQARKRTSKREGELPKSYLMDAFKHFAKTKLSADVYPVLTKIMDKYFQRLAEDLETYAAHAKRKTIEYEDCLLLLKRQGYVNDKVPVEVLIEKYLRMDQRRLLIPIATSGNVVMPQKR